MFKRVQFQSQSSPGTNMVRTAVTSANKDSPLRWKTVGEVNETPRPVAFPAERERSVKVRAYGEIMRMPVMQADFLLNFQKSRKIYVAGTD